MEKFKSDEITLSEIKELNIIGFSQIRIPGGTSLNEEHYSGTFISAYDEKSKKLFFLGVPYDPSFYKKNAYNGHTKKKGETPTETARREVYEETGLLVDENDMELIDSYSIKNRRDETKLHVRNFYLATDFNGTVSDFINKPNPIDNETATPLWISAKLFRQVLYKGHKSAFEKAVDKLKTVSLQYYYALCF